MKSLSIQNFHSERITPAVGKMVQPDGWGSWEELLPCDDWDRADYRIAVKKYDLAVRVEVTGNTVQMVEGVQAVRVKITFVGDCEPDSITRGWMYVAA